MARYHQVQWSFGRSLSRNFLPQAPPDVAHDCARDLELPGELYLPVAVDGSLAGVSESWKENGTHGVTGTRSFFKGIGVS